MFLTTFRMEFRFAFLNFTTPIYFLFVLPYTVLYSPRRKVFETLSRSYYDHDSMDLVYENPGIYSEQVYMESVPYNLDSC